MNRAAKNPPTAEVVTAEWMTREEALGALNIRERTLQDWASQGYIAFKMGDAAPGKRPARVYNAADVKKLVEEGGPARRRVSAPALLGHRAMSGPLLLQPPAALAPAPAEAPPRRFPPALWLTLEEAEEFSGLSEEYLRAVIGEGKLRAVRGGPHKAWRIHRGALEAFEG